MSQADTLRTAAALMRERAEAATPGLWMQVEVETRRMGHEYVVTTASTPTDGARPRILDADGWSRGKDTTHAASWHPTVALAVADWLDLTADDLAWYLDFGERLKERARATGRPGPEGDPERHRDVQAALAVARAYLGEVAP